MPTPSHGRSSAVTDDLYNGPTTLAPVDSGRGDRIARLIVWPLLILLFSVTIVFYILFSPLRVDGDSMVPTLHDQDRVLRTKSYKNPHRGDVVIVTIGEAPDSEIVKRIVALPGDTIEVRDDVAIINGSVEDTAGIVLATGMGETRPPQTVPAGYVYVMGDNRPVSLDSRFIGALPLKSVLGRAAFVFLPPQRFGVVR